MHQIATSTNTMAHTMTAAARRPIISGIAAVKSDIHNRKNTERITDSRTTADR